MSKIVKFAAAFGFVVAMTGIAQAMPAAVPADHGMSVAEQAAFGCPRGTHPNRFGRCERNGGPVIGVVPGRGFRPAPIVRGPVCPRGTRLAPSGRRCISRF